MAVKQKSISIKMTDLPNENFEWNFKIRFLNGIQF